MLLFHWGNRVRSDQVHLTTLLFCTVKSTIHSWDIPPLPNAQMLPPDLADEVNCSCDIQRLSRGARCWADGSEQNFRMEPNFFWGQKCRRWFLWQPLLIHLHSSLYTRTITIFFMCPPKAGGQTRHPTTLTVPSDSQGHTGRQTGKQVRSTLPFTWRGSLLVCGL